MRLAVALCVSALVVTGCSAASDDDPRSGATERVDRRSQPTEPTEGQGQESGQERDGDHGQSHEDQQESGRDRPPDDPQDRDRDRDRDQPDQEPPETEDEPKPPPKSSGAGSGDGGASRGSLPDGVPAGAQAAVVDRIIDGDTLELHARRPGRVLSSTTLTGVRLLEIDTPETVHPSEPVQCFGPAASDALARLAPVGSTVWVLPDEELTDYYDRTLLYLWSQSTGRTRFVNEQLVAEGFAKAALYEPNDRYIDAMYAAEAAARTADRGLWGHCSGFGAPLAQPEPDPRA